MRLKRFKRICYWNQRVILSDLLSVSGCVLTEAAVVVASNLAAWEVVVGQALKYFAKKIRLCDIQKQALVMISFKKILLM